MLRAPGGELAVHFDLALEDAVHAALERAPRRAALFLLHELVAWVSGDFAQENHQPHHGVVVEGDMAVIFVRGWRGILRPATVRILSLENVSESARESVGVRHGRAGGRPSHQAREEAQLVRGRAIVEGALQCRAVAGEGGGCVGILGPAARLGLPE